MNTFDAGDTIADKYELIEPLGSGGHGDVWRANQRGLDRDVAIKFLRRNLGENLRRRFDREARTLGQLDHPSCVQLFDFGHLDDGGSFLVVEFIDGLLLHDWIATKPALGEAIAVLTQVADALAHAHRHGIVHRDLKPANIMITRSTDGGLRARVLDFGIAKVLDSETDALTQTGEVLGTPGYMSPEQLRGERDVGPATDLYAFGVVMFEALSGRPPFEASTRLELASAHLSRPAPRLGAPIPGAVSDIVARLLEKRPQERFANASAVVEALRAMQVPDVGVSHRTATPEQQEPTTSVWRGDGGSVRRGAIATALVTVAAIAVAALVVGGEPEDDPVQRPIASDSTASLQPRVSSAERERTAIHDLGTKLGVDATPDDVAGCRKPMPKPGLHTIQLVDGLDVIEVLVAVPSGVLPSEQMPTLLLFHNALQPPRKAATKMGLQELAERDGWLIVAPYDARVRNTWMSRESRIRAVRALELLADRLCIDQERLFVTGHGSGGGAAEQMACDLPGVRGIASVSHRHMSNETPCNPKRAVPMLFLAPTRDGVDPLEGGPDCIGGNKLSLEEHIELLRDSRGCTGEREETLTGEHVCHRWACDVELTVCRLDGGRPWPGLEPRVPCEGRAPDFDVAGTVWEFFNRQLADE